MVMVIPLVEIDGPWLSFGLAVSPDCQLAPPTFFNEGTDPISMFYPLVGLAVGICALTASVLVFLPLAGDAWQCAGDGIHVTADILVDEQIHMDQAQMMERLTQALFPESSHLDDISGWWGGAARRVSISADATQSAGFVQLRMRKGNKGNLLLHMKAMKCDIQVAAGPERAHELVVAAKNASGSSDVKWAAKAVPEPSNPHLKQYFSMMNDISEPKELLASHKSNFSSAAIWHIRNSKTLVLNGVVMSDTSDEHIYHELMVHPALLACKEPRDVLIIGGAEGAVLREVLQDRRVQNVTMVEIDEGLVHMCRAHLSTMHHGSFQSPRASVLFADGIEFVKRTKDAAFDVVIIDGIDFSHGDIADYGNVLFSRELYNEMHRILRPGGVLAQYMSDVVRSEELKAAGFNQSVGLGVDIGSFFGGGAKFSLAAKDVEQPLASRISKQIVDGELQTKTRYLSAHSLEQSLKHIGRRLKGGGGGGGGDGCSGSSRCSNVIQWDGGLDGTRPELQLNAEPGDRHTDENGYCTYGHFYIVSSLEI